MTEKRYIPKGFSAAVPYLTVSDAAGLIAFIQQVFEATVLERSIRPDGSVGNAALGIDGAVIEVSDATENWKPLPAAIHVYVPDTDAAYHRALDAEATSIYEPTDMPYGERSGGVADPFGIYWYIATFTGRK